MTRTKTVKRIFCMLAAAALIVTSITPAAAATARATTMKLVKKEGTVTLKTQSGTSLRITEGMRLYNGNTISTASDSYAYISLDSSKAVKLDESSSATLRQKGKKLELLVKKGQLFFNVSKPLTSKERMNVRTSTMVTGIRGTCGVVQIISETKSRLYLIEGSVTLGSGEDAVTIQGGQAATVTLKKEKETDQPDQLADADQDAKQKVTVEAFTEAEIPAIALPEIMNDTALQEKIEEKTDFEIEKIEQAYEKLQQQETGQTQTEEQKTDSTSGSTSGGSTSGGQTTVTSTTLTGSGITVAQITTALSNFDVVNIGSETEEGTLPSGGQDESEIPSGKTLRLLEGQSISAFIKGDGTLEAATGASLTLESDYSILCNSITLTSGASLTNNGTLSIKACTMNGATLENTTTALLGNLTLKGDSNTITNAGKLCVSSVSQTKSNNCTYTGTSGILMATRKLTDSTLLGVNKLATVDVTTNGAVTSETIYASGLDEQVKKEIDGFAKVNGTIEYTFHNNVVVTGSSLTWNLAGADVDMGAHEIQVSEGCTLKLTDIGTISGTGKALIRLGTGAALTIDCTSESTSDNRLAQLSLRSTLSTSYVIAADKSTGSKITLKDPKTNINITGQNTERLIQGYNPNNTEGYTDYVTPKTGCKISVNASTNAAGLSSAALTLVEEKSGS